METVNFENCAQGVSVDELRDAENQLGRSLPADLRSEYLAHNGGNPENTLFHLDGYEDPFEVVGFYPIKYHTPAFETKESLLVEHYKSMLDRDVIPDYLLPFAHDPGGNFFCINLDDSSIIFYATDSFRSDLSPAGNHGSVQTVIAPSFTYFMSQLKRDPSLDADEWPDL